MSFTLLYDPLAEDDVKGHIDWYAEISIALAARFISGLKQTEKKITANPDAFLKIGKSSFRRALINKFPYAIYFRRENEAILIIAIIHFSRSNRYIKSRLKK